MRVPVGAGDVLRALATLELAPGRVASLLGLELQAATAPPPPTAPPRPAEEDRLPERGTREEPRPPRAAPGGARLVALGTDPSPELPPVELRSFPRRPRPLPGLVAPRRERALVSGLFSTRAPIGDLDEDRVVDRLARAEALDRLPRRALRTVRGGAVVVVEDALFELWAEDLRGILGRAHRMGLRLRLFRLGPEGPRAWAGAGPLRTHPGEAVVLFRDPAPRDRWSRHRQVAFGRVPARGLSWDEGTSAREVVGRGRARPEPAAGLVERVVAGLSLAGAVDRRMLREARRALTDAGPDLERRVLESAHVRAWDGGVVELAAPVEAPPAVLALAEAWLGPLPGRFGGKGGPTREEPDTVWILEAANRARAEGRDPTPILEEGAAALVHKPGLARWALGAARRLAVQGEAGFPLRLGAATRLGAPLPGPLPARLGRLLAAMLPADFPRVEIGVSVRGERLILDDRGGDQRLSVPATDPRILEVGGRVLAIPRGGRVVVSMAGLAELRSLTGERWALRWAVGEGDLPRGTRVLVVGPGGSARKAGRGAEGRVEGRVVGGAIDAALAALGWVRVERREVADLVVEELAEDGPTELGRWCRERGIPRLTLVVGAWAAPPRPAWTDATLAVVLDEATLRDWEAGALLSRRLRSALRRAAAPGLRGCGPVLEGLRWEGEADLFPEAGSLQLVGVAGVGKSALAAAAVAFAEVRGEPLAFHFFVPAPGWDDAAAARRSLAAQLKAIWAEEAATADLPDDLDLVLGTLVAAGHRPRLLIDGVDHCADPQAMRVEREGVQVLSTTRAPVRGLPTLQVAPDAARCQRAWGLDPDPDRAELIGAWGSLPGAFARFGRLGRVPELSTYRGVWQTLWTAGRWSGEVFDLLRLVGAAPVEVVVAALAERAAGADAELAREDGLWLDEHALRLGWCRSMPDVDPTRPIHPRAAAAALLATGAAWPVVNPAFRAFALRWAIPLRRWTDGPLPTALMVAVARELGVDALLEQLAEGGFGQLRERLGAERVAIGRGPEAIPSILAAGEADPEAETLAVEVVAARAAGFDLRGAIVGIEADGRVWTAEGRSVVAWVGAPPASSKSGGSREDRLLAVGTTARGKVEVFEKGLVVLSNSGPPRQWITPSPRPPVHIGARFVAAASDEGWFAVDLDSGKLGRWRGGAATCFAESGSEFFVGLADGRLAAVEAIDQQSDDPSPALHPSGVQAHSSSVRHLAARGGFVVSGGLDRRTWRGRVGRTRVFVSYAMQDGQVPAQRVEDLLRPLPAQLSPARDGTVSDLTDLESHRRGRSLPLDSHCAVWLDDHTVLLGCADGRVLRWGEGDPVEIHRHAGAVRHCGLLGELPWTASDDGSLVLHGATPTVLRGHRGPIAGVGVGADRLWSWDQTGLVRSWGRPSPDLAFRCLAELLPTDSWVRAIRGGEAVRPGPAHGDLPEAWTALADAPDGSRWWADESGDLRHEGPRGGGRVRREEVCRALAFAGELRAEGFDDGTVRVEDGSFRPPFPAHEGPVRGLAFSPDARLLASVGDDGQLCLWSLPDRVLRRRMGGHVGPVAGVAWLGPDRLLTAGDDATIRLWSLEEPVAALPVGSPCSCTGVASGAVLVGCADGRVLRVLHRSAGAPFRRTDEVEA